MAEAFQMPLAEATAVGLPVILPCGGAAEEFVDMASAVFVASVTKPRSSSVGGVLIHVDGAALANALETVMQNTSHKGGSAADHGPNWASRFLTMGRSADAVLAEITRQRR